MTVNLPSFLDSSGFRRQPPSRSEIDSLFKVVDRDLADAAVVGLSADRRFATAYNAALQLATIALRAHGHRTVGAGHHRNTFAALPQVLGADVQETADYLDACRARRNTVDYDGIGIAAEQDVEELLGEVRALRGTLERWLADVHPGLVGRG